MSLEATLPTSKLDDLRSQRRGQSRESVVERRIDVATEPKRPGELHADEPLGPSDKGACSDKRVILAGQRSQ